MARPLPLLLALLAALALVPASAQAVDRVVDDDKVQCPHAAFADVQSAVDAAQRGDVVRVCRGTYAGQVVVSAAKSNLKIVSSPARAAELTAPTGGVPFTGRNPLAILVSYGQGIYVSGFVISGPLAGPEALACGSHLHASGVAVPQGRTTIDGLRIQDTVVDCSHVYGCATCFDSVFGAGVHTGDVDGSFSSGPPDGGSGVVVDRTTIVGTRDGVLVEGGGSLPVTVQRSRLEGPGQDPYEGSFGIAIFEVCCGDSAPFLKVQSNELVRWDVGIWSAFDVEAAMVVRGNRVEDSTIGIGVDAGNARIERNTVRRGYFGITVGLDVSFEAARADVWENVVRDAGALGISVFTQFREPFCLEARCKSLLRDNSALGSGVLDCFADSVDGSRWTRNTGATALPAEICRAPRGNVSALRRAAERAENTHEKTIRDLGKRFRSSHDAPAP